MMKLADINQNNIKLGHGRETYSSYETAVPTSFDQKDYVDIDDDDEFNDDELGDDVDNIGKNIEMMSKLLSMANSYAPFRSVSDIRKVPNTSNIQ